MKSKIELSCSFCMESSRLCTTHLCVCCRMLVLRWQHGRKPWQMRATDIISAPSPGHHDRWASGIGEDLWTAGMDSCEPGLGWMTQCRVQYIYPSASHSLYWENDSLIYGSHRSYVMYAMLASWVLRYLYVHCWEQGWIKTLCEHNSQMLIQILSDTFVSVWTSRPTLPQSYQPLW